MKPAIFSAIFCVLAVGCSGYQSASTAAPGTSITVNVVSTAPSGSGSTGTGTASGTGGSTGSGGGNGSTGSTGTTGSGSLTSLTQFLSSLASLTWDRTVSGPSTAPTAVTYDFTLAVPYGRVYGAAAQVIKSLAPYTCQFLSTVENSTPQSYNAGEIPCGRIVDGSWKELISVPISPLSGSWSGIDYSINAFSLPVDISRAALSGTYQEQSLDTKSQVTLSSSTTFGEDLSVMYTPSGESASMELCMNIPGVTIKSDTQTISVDASKKILGVKIAEGASFQVNPGYASYNYGRACFSVDYGWTSPNLAPTVSLSTTQVPTLSGLQYQGLNITTNNWFLNLVASVLDVFNLNIQNIVQSKITSYANNYATSDVASGKWYSELHGNALLASAGSKINSQINKVMTRIGIPSTTQDLHTMMTDECNLLQLSSDPSFTTRMQTLCNTLINDIQFQVQPFYADSSSQSQGCYSYFAGVNDSVVNGQAKWWSQNCKFAAKFTVTLTGEALTYEEEFLTLWQQTIKSGQAPQSWQQFAAQEGLDEYTLKLLAQQLINQGYSSIPTANLPSVAGSLLSNLRSGLINTL